nr:hypothetical protein [uncultured Cupriavidus sp.]
MQPAQQSLLDQVLRKVGRNLLLNQELEHILKAILSCARIEGTIADAPIRLAKRQARLTTTSMGELQRQLRKELFAPEEDKSNAGPSDPTQIWISTSIRLEPADKETLEAELEALTDERNDLAHHFLDRWNPGSASAMEEVSSQLDAQRDKILAMRERLRSMHGTVTEMMRTVADFWQSREGIATLELGFLQSSRMIELLGEIAATPQRADGWTDLSYAAGIAHSMEPDAFANRKARYGEHSVKALIIKSELFEVIEEVLPQGTRTLMRNRPALGGQDVHLQRPTFHPSELNRY